MVGPYDSIIAEASRRYQVPPQYIRAVMGVESGGDPNAISNKGAGGLMQVMPATYAELAQKHGLGADRMDPRNSIMAGTAYLGQMFDQFGGDWNKALAAYNAGPGRVSGGRPLPAETRNYVPKVNAMIPQLSRPRPGQTVGYGAVPGNERELRGLFDHLDIPPERNQADGLGGLLNMGQTPTQPPRPDDPVGGRIDDLMSRLAQPVQRGPQLSPGQYQLAGAGAAVGQLAGITNRKVGFGELLGALGGGLTRGTNAADQAQQQQRAAEFSELGNMTKLQQHQRGEATAASKVEAARRYAAQLIASGDPNQVAMGQAIAKDPSLIDNIIAKQAEQAWPKDATTPLEKHARAAGHIPGTPGYQKFIQDNAGQGTRINLNTAENHAGKGLADIRVEQYKDLRNRGQNAGKMLDKLGQLETVLDEIGTTGPGTPALSRVIGWAQQAGIPTAEITKLYEDYTGQNMADPAKVDLAQKLIQDFVTQSIKTLGANPTDTDLRTLQQANPSITNQREANQYIIRNTLRPQYEYDRDLWESVRGLDGKDQTLDTLETRIADFERRKREEKEASKPKDSPPQQAPDAAQITQQFPGARQMKDGRWAAPDPSSKTGWRLIVPQ